MAAKEIALKPQEILFEEGDQSKNLYFVKKGVVRIFKRKAEGNIEIETIRNGQVIGELSFFDGQPRSASAEALTTTELIEIPRSDLDDALSKLPEWLVTLTKTIASRVRAANNRIRLLESLSTEYGVDKHGTRSKEYVYLPVNDLLRFSTALLTVASRYGKNATTDGIEFAPALLDRFASQILQVSTSKVVSLVELFKSVEILKGELFLTDIRFLDQFIQYLNDQNLVDVPKRQTLTSPGFQILSLMVQNRAKATTTPDSTMVKLNIAPFLKSTKLQVNQLQELFDQGFVKNITIKSTDEIILEFDGAKDVFLYRTFWLFSELDKLNAQKRRG